MADPSFDETTFVIIGPTQAGFEALKLRYPRRKLRFVQAPYPLLPGSAEWDRCVAELCEGEWQIGLLGLPMPLQQILAKALAERGRGTGLALCVGAAVDFLTGWQRRAPLWVRRTGLESLHRLQANPRTMWRRYLIEAPQIFPM
jgi:exopolysaccharide biosynthesis WecB/TagA/CpsF family protein